MEEQASLPVGFHEWGLAAGVQIFGAPVISRPALSDRSTDVIPNFVTNLCLQRPSGMCSMPSHGHGL